MAERRYTIGEVAEQTGVAPSALRYYEDLGLMPRAPRVSGQRRYRQDAVDLVGMILLLRDVGFSLAEIKALVASRLPSPGDWRELALRKLTELDDRISRAEVARIALQHALRCRHEDLLHCPNFTGVLAARLAGKPLAEAHAH